MKEGMGPAFSGSFNGPLHAKTYEDGLSSQANPESLDKSGIGILVASLYANPFFVRSLRDSIRSQIRLAQDFVGNHANWMIAKNPTQARQAIHMGKHVLILSLEGASGILETEEDLKEFIDTDGISIVTLLHLTDDEYGGVALLKGGKVFSDPWAWFKSLFSPNRVDGIKTNLNGLTSEGRNFTENLMARKVWIDLSHASDATQRELVPMLRMNGLPLLYTHTVLRKYHSAERAITESQINEVKRSGGLIGLVPSEEMLDGTPDLPGCDTPLGQLVVQYKEIAQTLNPAQINFGSDFNGALNHLRPGCGLSEGLWNISQVPALWDALKKLGAPIPEPRSLMVDTFLSTWSRIRD